MPFTPAWRIVEDTCVMPLVAQAHASYLRFHDLYDGLTWRLCHDPVPNEARQIAPETYVVKSDKLLYDGFCVVTLVYSLQTDENVIQIEDLIVDPA